MFQAIIHCIQTAKYIFLIITESQKYQKCTYLDRKLKIPDQNHASEGLNLGILIIVSQGKGPLKFLN